MALPKKSIVRRLSGAFNIINTDASDLTDAALLAEFDKISLEVEQASESGQVTRARPSVTSDATPSEPLVPVKKFGFSEQFARRIQSAPAGGRRVCCSAGVMCDNSAGAQASRAWATGSGTSSGSKSTCIPCRMSARRRGAPACRIRFRSSTTVFFASFHSTSLVHWRSRSWQSQ